MVDIGANMGLASITFAMRNPTAKIYAYEINPLTFSVLRNNINLNRLDSRVKIFNKALGGGFNHLSLPNCSVLIGTGSQVLRSREQWELTYGKGALA